jgi:hypothetical protein
MLEELSSSRQLETVQEEEQVVVEQVQGAVQV